MSNHNDSQLLSSKLVTAYPVWPLLFILVIGCVTPSEISDMKTNAQQSLKNINTISEVVKASLGTEKEAVERTKVVDSTLVNVRDITAQVKGVTEEVKRASSLLGNVSKAVDEVTARVNDQEKGLPEVLRQLDGAMGKVDRSTANIESATAKIDNLLSDQGLAVVKKNVEDSSNTLALGLNKVVRVADEAADIAVKVNRQFEFEDDMIPATIRSVRALTTNLSTTAIAFKTASIFIVGAVVALALCFAYAAYMLFKFHRQQARFEAMANLRAVTENLMVENGEVKWKIPARNIVFKANIRRLFKETRPLLEEVRRADCPLTDAFVDELFEGQNG